MAQRLVLLPLRISRSPSSRRLVWTSAHAELTAVFPLQKQGGCTQAGLQHAVTVPEDMECSTRTPQRHRHANRQLTGTKRNRTSSRAGRRHIGTERQYLRHPRGRVMHACGAKWPEPRAPATAERALRLRWEAIESTSGCHSQTTPPPLPGLDQCPYTHDGELSRGRAPKLPPPPQREQRWPEPRQYVWCP